VDEEALKGSRHSVQISDQESEKTLQFKHDTNPVPGGYKYRELVLQVEGV
jgi:hypothetical protein